MIESKYSSIGKLYPRKDGIPKVTGTEKYASDISSPNTLYAKVLVSPYPHAKVKSIDTSEAEKMGAVCITFKDIPKKIYCERIEENLKDKMVLTDRPLHIGDRIAAVAAETEEEAQKALELIKVEYEVLEPVLDPVKSMEAGRLDLHDFVIFKDKKIRISNNVATIMETTRGDTEKGFKEADVIVENEYRTGRTYHAQLETKTAVCQPEPDGSITIWVTTQAIHDVRILIGQIFGIPLNKVNVKKVSIGGTFGSSLHMNPIVPICVALALKAKRTVKLVSSREEDMHDHCRYSTIIKCKLGAKKDGTLIAGSMKVLLDIGAYNTQANIIFGAMIGYFFNHYRIPNMKFESKGIYTNKVSGCAMQGFGDPQVTFVVETQMDELAEKLGMDPIDLKLKNYVGLGDKFHITPTVQTTIRSCGLGEILKKGSELIGWGRRLKSGEQKGVIRRGIGVAKGLNVSGIGAPMPIRLDHSGAMIKINVDGTVDLVTPLMDHGGGTLDACAKIVAEELGVPLYNVGISPVDTRTTPYGVCVHASRGVYVEGLTVKKVASQVKEKLLKFASRILEVPVDALRVRPNEEIGQGIIYTEGVQGKELTVGEVAETARRNNWGTIASIDNYTPLDCSPSFVALFLEVEVNTKTGKIKPIRVLMGCDSGTLINPRLGEGQLHGGLYRGLGFALSEDTIYEAETGKLLGNGYLTDYKMLTADDLPSLGNTGIFFTDTYEPTGPFGAKGVGEVGINPVAACLANAVYNAIGIRFREIPITPEKVIAALREKKGGRA